MILLCVFCKLIAAPKGYVVVVVVVIAAPKEYDV